MNNETLANGYQYSKSLLCLWTYFHNLRDVKANSELISFDIGTNSVLFLQINRINKATIVKKQYILTKGAWRPLPFAETKHCQRISRIDTIQSTFTSQRHAADVSRFNRNCNCISSWQSFDTSIACLSKRLCDMSKLTRNLVSLRYSPLALPSKAFQRVRELNLDRSNVSLLWIQNTPSFQLSSRNS